MITIKAGGRKLALDFNMAAMDELEGVLGEAIDITNLQDAVVSKLRDRKTLMGVFYVLAREGEIKAGRKPDFDREALARSIRPAQQLQIQFAVIRAMTEGMTMETDDGDGDDEVDVVLEEIKKKQGLDG